MTKQLLVEFKEKNPSGCWEVWERFHHNSGAQAEYCRSGSNWKDTEIGILGRKNNDGKEM